MKQYGVMPSELLWAQHGQFMPALSSRCFSIIGASKNQGPQHRPQIVGLPVQGHLQEGPPIYGNSPMEATSMGTRFRLRQAEWPGDVTQLAAPRQQFLPVAAASWVWLNFDAHFMLLLGSQAPHPLFRSFAARRPQNTAELSAAVAGMPQGSAERVEGDHQGYRRDAGSLHMGSVPGEIRS